VYSSAYNLIFSLISPVFIFSHRRPNEAIRVPFLCFRPFPPRSCLLKRTGVIPGRARPTTCSLFPSQMIFLALSCTTSPQAGFLALSFRVDTNLRTGGTIKAPPPSLSEMQVLVIASTVVPPFPSGTFFVFPLPHIFVHLFPFPERGQMVAESLFLKPSFHFSATFQTAFPRPHSSLDLKGGNQTRLAEENLPSPFPL